jgi:DNA-binding transcriptional ArsR family regulator
MKNILWWLIIGSKGGINRAEIIKALRERPYTAVQLAEHLKLDYTTIRYHLKVLQDNNIIDTTGKKYGETYYLSQQMESNYNLFQEILEKIGKE